MRAGGCTVQQTLTTEAAAVLQQAVVLARRRGHAQVTPLHVANTMLSSSVGLLRTACLRSHSHPLQCKALELCFNVALNRLPASTSSPILGSHNIYQYPSISNALVAAFKRAQAHQRRGSIENQQQPILTVKIELQQLIISILDDPSVSRVMKEAGFSSTQVKSNVEQAVSLEISSQNTATITNISNDLVPSRTQVGEKPSCRALITTNATTDPARNEDVKSVIESLTNKRKRSIVIVGESLASVEGVVNGVMDMVIKGDVPEALREVKFIPFPFSALGHLSSRVEVDQELEDVKARVRGYLSKGVVLNLGDLNWVTDYRANNMCLVEHIIVEIGQIARGICENNGKFWLMGVATFQTYMKCKSGHSSLETLWGLHALTIPSTNLSLSLVTDSGIQSRPTIGKVGDQNGSGHWITHEGEEQKQLTCFVDCTSKSENEEDRSLQSSTRKSNSTATSNLPSWLQKYKNESKGLANSNDQDCASIKDLCNRWNSISSSIHQKPCSSEKTITFSSVSPSSSMSGFSYDHQYPNSNQNHHLHHDWLMTGPNQSWRDRHFWVGSESVNKSSTCISSEPNMGMNLRGKNREKDYSEPTVPFSSYPNSTPNSTSSSDVMEMEYVHGFKELSSENLKSLSKALEKKVPWQKDIIPDIASTILQCRSGMVRRKGKVTRNSRSDHQAAKEETWLLFQGVDIEGKEKIAKELARTVFGSENYFISMALSNFSSTRADSTEDCRNKRSRDQQSCSYIERFAEAVSSNPHRVFLMEDVEQADYCSQMRFKRAIESGRIANAGGEEVNLHDAIIILSCESFSSRSRACSPLVKQKTNDNSHAYGSLDLNISLDDYSGDQDQSIDDIGLLESVDRRMVFKIHDF